MSEMCLDNFGRDICYLFRLELEILSLLLMNFSGLNILMIIRREEFDSFSVSTYTYTQCSHILYCNDKGPIQLFIATCM